MNATTHTTAFLNATNKVLASKKQSQKAFYNANLGAIVVVDPKENQVQFLIRNAYDLKIFTA